MYTIKSKNRVGAGTYYRLTHQSTSTQTPMTFGLFVPSRYIDNIEGDKKDTVPVVYWLSGLTCDDTNFAMKAGPKAFMAAEKEVRLLDVWIGILLSCLSNTSLVHFRALQL
jgi:S-formylglutathione hydrolase FrmB